jgi:60 kDa SS-A/Ro ribonucleoprotein
MGKFNTKRVGVVPTEINEMGEKAYKLDPKEELVSTCLTTFLQRSYYETEDAIVGRILKCIKEVNDPLFIAKLAIYLRHSANMRSVSHLLAGELASLISGEKWASNFYLQVYGRPDDMTEILAYIFSKQTKRKIPSSVKKAFSKILSNLDPHTIDKYKMKGREISLIDLVNLIHPKPTQKNNEAYRRLMSGISLNGLYENKTVEAVMSETGNLVKNSDESIEELKGEALRTILLQPKGMAIMSLLRNLRNILIYAPDMVYKVVEQLTDKNRILHSRQLPFRFANAYNEIEKLSLPSTPMVSVKFEKDITLSPKKAIMDSLEIALNYSLENIPKLEGSSAFLIDHSGSVRGDLGGSGKLSAFGITTSAMVGNLLASMYAYSQDNVYIGLFGDRLIDVPINRRMGVIEFNNYSFNEGAKCGGSTENGLYIFLNNCIKENIKVDNLIIFSDMVIGDGGVGGWDATSNYRSFGTFQILFKKFKLINPQCNTVSVNIRQTGGKSVLDRSLGVTRVSGWSTSIFDIISRSSQQNNNLIEEINAIEII